MNIHQTILLYGYTVVVRHFLDKFVLVKKNRIEKMFFTDNIFSVKITFLFTYKMILNNLCIAGHISAQSRENYLYLIVKLFRSDNPETFLYLLHVNIS